jgi:hypothetical protein
MDIQYQASDSSWQWFIQPHDVFRLYANRSDLQFVEITGAQVIQALAVYYAQAQMTLGLAQRIAALEAPQRTLSPPPEISSKRRLVGQHKSLKTLPGSPHQ